MQNRPIKNLTQFLNKELIFMPTDLNKLIGEFTYCCPDDECKRCIYKEKYSGVQDKSIRVTPLLNYEDLEFLASPFFQRSHHNGIYRNGIRHVYPLVMPSNTIVKNFRLKNMENVRWIEVEIGGQRIDKVYKDIIPILQDLYEFEKDVIPFYFSKSGINSLQYHEIKILVEYNETLEDDGLTFDIYKWDPTKTVEGIIYQLQFTGTENLSDEILKEVKLCFNHPILHLMVKGYHPDELELEFDDNDKFYIKKTKTIGDISLYSIVDNFYDYKNGINFSRINKPKLIIRDKDVRSIDTYSIGCQPLRCMSGMAGLAFSM